MSQSFSRLDVGLSAYNDNDNKDCEANYISYVVEMKLGTVSLKFP